MELIVLSVLVLINGFFALSEIALVSSKKNRLEQRLLNGSKGAKVALKLLNDSENFLSAIQVGITLIGIVTGVYGGMNIADDITPFFLKFESISLYAKEIALTLTVMAITYVSIVIGELVPKTIAISNPEQIATKVAPFIYYFSRIFYPFVFVLSYSTNFINKLLGIKQKSEHITEAEIRLLIKNASKQGVIEKEQNSFHEKVFYFADKRAKHIMTRRQDVEWINFDKPISEIKDKLLKCQHSKIVCCNGNLDNLVGIISLNNIYKSLALNSDFDINEQLAKPIIIPEDIDAQQIPSIMRQNKTHICCVMSEFGGFEGLITLHDIIEHIVGQMPEEGETFEPNIFIREDNSVLVNGDTPIESLNEVIHGYDVNFEIIDYSTVAGFVINQLGRMPKLGDIVYHLGYRIEIVDMDGRKIDKILIQKL
jgi:putative hemolysin